LKDRNAITEQAFTVPVRSAVGSDWLGVTGEGFEVIGAARHRRKLKRGALRANDFQIVVREFSGDAEVLAKRVAAIAAQGVPNYFGPQRFGIEGGNLTRARRLFGGEIEIHDRLERGFALSAARASIFNAVLARRVADGTWNQIQAGDVANLSGSNSVFVVDAVDETLMQRCGVLDIHPTGPMWGREPTTAQGATAALEQAVASEQASLATGLERAGLETQRRSLRLPVGNLEWALSGDELQLSFRLPRGAFATAVMHELLGNAFAQGGLSEQEEE
jgi:tRNA pseudouridine13 synthase